MPHRYRGAAALVAALAVGCLLGAGAASSLPSDERAPATAAGYQTPIIYAMTNRGLKPSRLQAYGRTHYYQLAEQPIGTLVFFHGCSRSAKGFFPYHPKDCQECLGLPEDVSHTKQALARGYTLLAMEPHDEKGLCWSSSVKGGYVNDQPDAIAAITRFLLDRGLADKPVYLAGASSGGTFALKLPATLYLAAKSAGALSLEQASAMAEAFNGSAASVPDLAGALAAAASAGGMLGVGEGATGRANATAAPFYLQVHGIITEVSTPTDFGAADSMGRLRWPNYPCTAFVTMERDLSGQREAQTNMMFFTRNGVPSATIVSPKRRIGPSYFSDRAPVISLEQSGRIVAALKQIGLIDGDGQLAANPKDDDKPGSMAYRWDTKLQQALPWLGSGPLTLQFRKSLIRQALFVAYANHEHVSDYMTACLAWLETGGRSDLTRLAQQLAVPRGNLSALTADRAYSPGGDPGVEISSDRSPPPPRPLPSPPPSPAPRRSPPSPPPPSPPPRSLPAPAVRSPPPSPVPRRQLPPPAGATAPWPAELPAGAPPPWWTSAAVFFQHGQPASPPRPPSPPSSPPSPAPRPPWPSPGAPTTQPPSSSPPPPLPPSGCRDKRCTSCSADGTICSACLKGFRPSAEGICVLACTDPRCVQCKFHPSWCVLCAAGLSRVAGTCIAA